MIHPVITFFGKVALGVNDWYGSKFWIKPARIRLYFINCAFVIPGSFLLPFLIMAMVLGITIWDI